MKTLGATLLIVIAGASFAFADQPTNAQPGAQGTVIQNGQYDNGKVVRKSKKHLNDTNAGAPQGAQGTQTGAGSR